MRSPRTGVAAGTSCARNVLLTGAGPMGTAKESAGSLRELFAKALQTADELPRPGAAIAGAGKAQAA